MSSPSGRGTDGDREPAASDDLTYADESLSRGNAPDAPADPEPPPRSSDAPPSGWPSSLDEIEPLPASADSASPTGEGAYAPLGAEPAYASDDRRGNDSRSDNRAISSRRLAAWLISGTALAMALLVAAGALLGLGPWSPRADPSAAPVQFLQAVAAGDSDLALALQVEEPTNRTLLTDEVLRASADRAPISNIRVVSSDPTTPGVEDDMVTVAYNLGEREITARFEPVRQRDGSFKIRRGITTLDVSRPKNVPVFINGVRVDVNRAEAFPGFYEMTTGMDTLRFDEPEFTVSGPLSTPRVAPVPELSEEGTRAFLDAARTRLTACVAAKEVNPLGCPQATVPLLPNQRPATPTIEWTLLNDPFRGVSPQLTLADETVAEARLTVRMRLQGAIVQSGEPGLTDQVFEFATTAAGQVSSTPITVAFVQS